MKGFLATKFGKIAIGISICIGMVMTVALFATSNATASGSFCLSCHEMKDNMEPDYLKSTHAVNASGVQATCSSCHVSEELLPMLKRKAAATRELVQSVKGVIDTPEKFAENRYRLAKRVWKEMEENDSRECRACHKESAFDYSKFKKAASAKQMKKGLATGSTCITCHKGIVHKLPDMSSGYKLIFNDLKELSKEGLSSNEQYPLITTPLYKEKNGKAMGKILAATQLEVVDTESDWLQVRIDGWQQDGVAGMIYGAQGKRIFSASLSKKIRPEIKRHETMVDPDTEQTWHSVSLTCWVKKDNLIGDREKLWEYGSEMLSSACSTCHSATPPAHFKANQWIGNLKSMKHNISLTKEEYRFFLKYLQMHASDMGYGH